MLIDWFTVGAQLLNFIILVWLMKRFLYQPVLDAIEAREQKIAAELAEAAATQAEAHRQRHEFQKKSREFDERRDLMLHEAKEAAAAERQSLMLKAREQADAASAKRASALRAETQHLYAEIVRHTQQQVFDISRKVLVELAGVSLEQRIGEVFVQRLQAIDGPALTTLSLALQGVSDADPALLRSAFDLSKPQQAQIQAALKASFGQPIHLKFETSPELVSGIELSAHGQKLAWSISDYLDALSSGLPERPGVEEAA